VLVVLDGFGIGRDPAGDAIAAAPMPTWRGLLERWPHSVLQASEGAVGLPAGQMGNSEVGHLNLGAGRPVLQDLPRIDAAIADGSFDERPAFLAAIERAAATSGRLHAITPTTGTSSRWPRSRTTMVSGSRSTRCSTVATRRRRPRSGTWPTSSRGWPLSTRGP
jgi:bisphosphoglycerate-independent phosphoglycerate mutase (AlkP superfamily)